MRTALALALVAVACSSPRSPSGDEVTAADARRLLVDRNWMDVWPHDKDDRIHVFRFVPSMGGGVYQDRTIFQGEFELFMFRTQGRELELVLPHRDEKFRTSYRIERVDGPKPFDLKLTLERSPRGPRTYYGIMAEVDTSGVSLENRLQALRTSAP